MPDPDEIGSLDKVRDEWPRPPGYTPPPQMFWKNRVGRKMVLVYLGLIALLIGLGLQVILDPDKFIPWGYALGIYQVLQVGIIVGLVFVMALMWNKLRYRGEKVPGPFCCKVFNVDVSALEVSGRVEQALGAQKAKINERASDPVGCSYCIATTGMNWKSWGDRVDVLWKPTDAGCQVWMSCTPKLTTTVVDFGRGRDVLERLAAAIERGV